MQEVLAAGNAQELSNPIEEGFADRMLAVTEGMGSYRPSMMIDRQEQRPLELESIYQIPLQRAAARHVAMPRVQLLHALLSLGEQGLQP
jgi:2-dehydropantoate 2-reductase